MSFTFGLRLPPCLPVREVAAEAARAERAGFDNVWIPDSQMLWRDVWVTLSAVALATDRVRIGTNITTPITRHPTVTANAITTLDELSGGRAILGFGPGDSSVRVIGGQPATLQTMRESIQLIRAFSSGQWLPHGKEGAQIRMKTAEGRRKAVPIYMAASGPKMLQLAGEVADGVILLCGFEDENLQYALSRIQAGLDRSGRKLEDLDLVMSAHTYVGDDWRQAQKLARPYAAYFAMHSPGALRALGIRVPEPRPMDIYPDINHAEDWDKAIAVSDWVPDDVLELFCAKYTLMGDAGEIIRKLERVASHGISHFYMLGYSSYRLPREVADTFARQVIPHFRIRKTDGAS